MQQPGEKAFEECAHIRHAGSSGAEVIENHGLDWAMLLSILLAVSGVSIALFSLLAARKRRRTYKGSTPVMDLTYPMPSGLPRMVSEMASERGDEHAGILIPGGNELP